MVLVSKAAGAIQDTVSEKNWNQRKEDRWGEEAETSPPRKTAKRRLKKRLWCFFRRKERSLSRKQGPGLSGLVLGGGERSKTTPAHLEGKPTSCDKGLGEVTLEGAHDNVAKRKHNLMTHKRKKNTEEEGGMRGVHHV